MEEKTDPHSPQGKADEWKEYKNLVQQRNIETEQKLREHETIYGKIQKKLDSMGSTVSRQLGTERQKTEEGKRQEESLEEAIRKLDLSRDIVFHPNSYGQKKGHLSQILENLETEHNNCVRVQSLDMNTEPENSYIEGFRCKVSRALKRQKIKLQIQEINNFGACLGPRNLKPKT